MSLTSGLTSALTAPNQSCTLEVPSDGNAQVMVRGYTAGTHRLEVAVAAP